MLSMVIIIASFSVEDLSAFAQSIENIADNSNCEIESTDDILEMSEFLSDADFVEDIEIDTSCSDEARITADTVEVSLSAIVENDSENADEIINTFAASQNYDDVYLNEAQLSELGYKCSINDEKVKLVNEYQTKRLIAYDDVDNTYGAIDGISYDDFTILKYDSIKATIDAQKQIEKDNVKVSVDIPVSCSYVAEDLKKEYGRVNLETERFINSNINVNTAKDVIVAVIDTGIDFDHEFLKDRIVDGINLFDDSKKPVDDHYHGTHVSGIIVNNTPSNVKIMPIKALNSIGQGSLSLAATGIKYAVDNGARVINMSLGGIVFGADDTEFIDQAIAYATKKGVVCVVAAGNESSFTDKFSPANNQQAITVGAVGEIDGHCSFSNIGKSVDISAPGLSILSTVPGNGYKKLSGTSMATPFVAASAALFLCENSVLTAEQVKTKIESTAVDLGVKGKDYIYGAGRIDFGYFLGDRVPGETFSVSYTNSKVLYYSKYLISAPELLDTSVLPKDATDKSFTFEAEADGIVDLSKGYIEPIGVGKTKVTLTLDSGVKKTITVNVQDRESWLDAAADSYAGGDGTLENPYLIETPEQLAKVSLDYFQCKLPYNVFFEQIADIDLKGKQWFPIICRDEGCVSSRCNFDGGGYKISNLTYSSSKALKKYDGLYVGFFYKNCGLIDNVNLVDVDISSMAENVGGIVGESDGIINDCTVSGKIKGSYNVGGIAGSYCQINSFGCDIAVLNCYVDADITGKYPGGMIGKLYTGNVANCVFMGSLSSTVSETAVGGIAYQIDNMCGYKDDTQIVNCISNCNIVYDKYLNNSRGIVQSDEEFEGTVLEAYVKNCYCYKNYLHTDQSPETTDIVGIDDIFVKDSSVFTNDELWDNEFTWDLNTKWTVDENGIHHKRQGNRAKCKNYYFGDLGNSIVLYGYTGKSTELKLPSTINSKPVKYIGNDFYYPNTKIKSIVLPSSLKRILNSAFCLNRDIEIIKLNEGLESIGTLAFYDCTYLLSFELPSTLKHLGYYAFAECLNLQNIFFKCSADCADSQYNFSNNYSSTQVRYLSKYKSSFEKRQWGAAKISSYDPSKVNEISFRKYDDFYYDLNSVGSIEVKLKYKESVKLNPFIFNTNAINNKIIWSSSKPSSVSVSSNGTVTMKGEQGATITAKAEDGSCKDTIRIEFAGYNPYTVVFKGNGATSGSMPNQVIEMLDFTSLNANKFVRTGYVFQGWATSASGPVLYENKELVYMLDSSRLGKTVTLYAKWKLNHTHNYSTIKVTKPATYASAGEKQVKCTVCGAVKKESIPKKVLSVPTGIKLTSKKKSFTVSWKKHSTATGYQIQYSISSKFTSAKTVTISKNSTVSKTIKSLKSNKKYYVRIRAYKTIDGKKYYSSWSSAKTVKTK